MADLATISQFAVGQPALLTRFKAARLQVAWNILAEAGNTANHAARLVWAQKVFTNYEEDAEKEYRWCLSHALIQASGTNITDANLVTATGSFVDAWTGA